MDEKYAVDELQFIKKIIEDSKRNLVYNGREHIGWGLLISFALIVDYLNYFFGWNFHFLLYWGIVVALGWLFSYYSSQQRKKENCPKTFAGKMMGTIWLGTGIGMTLVGFVGITSGAIPGTSISALLSVFLGSAFLISGYLHSEKWMKYLSIGWWLGAVIMFFYPGVHTVFIMAFMLLFLQVLPGVYFYKKFKKETELQ